MPARWVIEKGRLIEGGVEATSLVWSVALNHSFRPICRILVSLPQLAPPNALGPSQARLSMQAASTIAFTGYRTTAIFYSHYPSPVGVYERASSSAFFALAAAQASKASCAPQSPARSIVAAALALRLLIPSCNVRS